MLWKKEVLMNPFALVLFASLVSLQGRAHESAEATAARIRDARPIGRAHIERRAEALGIYDFDQQLREFDALALDTSVIFRYQQYERGVKVYAAGITVQVWRDSVTESNGFVFPLRVNTTPKIPEAEAIATAFRHLDVSRKTNQAKAALVVVAHARFGPRLPVDDRLAWRVELWGT
ncbi:MAG TPA: hypothetical protein VM733_09830, partial [Thermoanaerobaculia bacterium]|nr:hypothetical protein [Thermoanaerobaculia bacterium]